MPVYNISQLGETKSESQRRKPSHEQKNPRIPVPPVDSEGVDNPTMLQKGRAGVREAYAGLGSRLAGTGASIKETAVEGVGRIAAGGEDIKQAFGPDTYLRETGDIIEGSADIAKRDKMNRFEQFLQGFTQMAGGAVETGLSPITGGISGIIEPEIKAGIEKLQRDLSPEDQAVLSEKFKPVKEWYDSMPEADKQNLHTLVDMFDVATLGAGGTGRKVLKEAGEVIAEKTPGAVKAVTEGAEAVIQTTKEGAKMLDEVYPKVQSKVDDFFSEREAAKQEKMITQGTEQISKGVDDLVNQNKAIKNSVNKFAKKRNTDIVANLKDPEIYSRLKVDNGSINVDEAVAYLDDSLLRASEIKKELIPLADELAPPINKQQLRQRAYDMMDELSPADQQALIKRIDTQIDALPDEIKISELDKLRAQFRNSSRDAQGAMKSASEYSALESASRDLVFQSFDNLGIGEAGQFAALHQTIKNNLDMVDFLETSLDGKKVAGGRLGKMSAEVIGAVAGSQGGPFGSILGAKLGGAVQNILMDKQLGNAIKREMIENMLKDKPDMLKQIEGMLDEALKARAAKL